MKKIFYIIIAITTIFFLGTGLMVFQHEKNLYIEVSRENIHHELVILGSMAQLDLLSNDYSQVEENLLNWVEHKNYLIFVEVYLDGGFRIAQYGKKSQITNHFTVTETLPRFDGGNLIYTADFSTEFIDQQAKSLFIKILIYGAIITILLLVSLWMLMYKVAVVPLNRLMVGTQKIGQGDFDMSIKVESKDEFGKLASGFNLMAARLNGLIDELRRSEQKFRNIFDNSSDAIFVLDLKGKMLNVNSVAFQRLGYTREEFMEMTPMDFNSPEFSDSVRDRIEKLMKEGHLIFETCHISKEGKDIPTEVNSRTIEYEGELALLNVARDITERKTAEKEQKRLTEELLIKNKELEQILYVTSHDLRSPLVNVDGYSKELEYSLKELMSFIENMKDSSNIKDKITSIVKEDIPESLHYIQISVSKMGTLLKGILHLSRLGRYELTIEEIDMNTMMSDIVDSHRFRLNELKIKTDVSILPNCKGDSSQINQVFSNLLDNAVKYTDSERPGVIHISGYIDKNQSVYCIEDNGLGMAPEHQNKIFEIFYQLEPNRVKGEGMGLTIAHRIIDRHQGEIWVESELGKGSKFFVSLPKA